MMGPDGRIDGGPDPEPSSRRRETLVPLTLSTFIVALDSAIVVIALPALLEDLGGTFDEVTWVIAAFILTFAVFLIPCRRLADIYDGRALFLCGVAVFAAASLGCALSPSIGVLILARAAQGVGAAMAESAGLALITATIPRERLGRALGVQGGAFGLGAVLGPILGGLIVTGLSWEFIFWLDVVVGVVVLAGTALLVPGYRARGATRGLDPTGVASGGAGLFLLVFAVIEGERFGWGSALIPGSFAVSVALLLLFVFNESRVREPLVDLALFRYRTFASGSVLQGINEFASLGIFFGLSHFMQVQLGYSALASGALLMSVIGGALVVSPLSERPPGRLDARWLVVPGFLLVAAGTFWVAHVSPQTGWTFFIVPLALAGVGFGALESPTTNATRGAVPDPLSDEARSVSYVAYLLGILFGVAVVSGVWQSRFATNAGDVLSATAPRARAAEGISHFLSRGEVSGAGAARIESLIEGPFADAANAALLCCVAVALLGAVVALFLSSGRKKGAVGGSG